MAETNEGSAEILCHGHINIQFDEDMQIMSKFISTILRKLYSHVSTDILDSTYGFKSCTILSYFGVKNVKQHLNMPFHGDIKYTK